VDARNALEGYTYNLKNQLDDEKGLGAKLESEDKEALTSAVAEALEWLEEHPSADVDEFSAKQKELERVVNPIVSKVYQGSNSGTGGGAEGGGDDDDFVHEEL